MKKSIFHSAMLALAAFGLLWSITSCDDTEYEFSNYPCYFVFDNTASRSPMLATAMNPLSPGIFCHISVSGKYFVFNTNATSATTERVAFNAIDEQRSLRLGAYNESGIIVGYGNLNAPPTFYAYDNQCPNCYEESNLPRYLLTMLTTGKAKCNNCHREYDMNNGGIVSKGDNGRKLIRYKASTTGVQGILSVVNG